MQNKQPLDPAEQEALIDLIISLIPEYLKKYPNYNTLIEWNNTRLIEWEFHLLLDKEAITKKDIVFNSLFYIYFRQAKYKYFKHIDKIEYARKINEPNNYGLRI